MKIKSIDLIQDLQDRTHSHIAEVLQFQQLPLEALNWRNSADSWSALECLEHLNLYGDFYLKEIEKRILASDTENKPIFKTGFLGNYFAESMLPKAKLKKMKTFKDKDPRGSKLDKQCIERFLLQQQKTLELLELAKEVDLGKIRTSISIAKWIRLKLGDTFRVVIYHNERHIVQARKILRLSSLSMADSNPS